MLLVGLYDSPFVRRLGIALCVYGLKFEQRPLSVFSDEDRFRLHSPLCRAPTLILDDGLALVDSGVCLEVLDARIAEERGPGELLLPRAGPLRTQGLWALGLCVAAMEKAVSWVYETGLRDVVHEPWLRRCGRQVHGALTLLEEAYQRQAGPWLLGQRWSHADIAVSCLLTFIDEACPELLDGADWPALRAIQQACEQQPIFRRVYQPFELPRAQTAPGVEARD